MAQPDITVSLGSCGYFDSVTPATVSCAVPAGRFWNAYLTCVSDPRNLSFTTQVTVHGPSGNFSSSASTDAGLTHTVFLQAISNTLSMNGCAGHTVNIDFFTGGGSATFGFTSIVLTLQVMESLVQCDTWQHTLATTWMEGYDTYTAMHLAPQSAIGAGSTGWETAVKIGGAGLGVGGYPAHSSWLMFDPQGDCFLTPHQGSLSGVWRNRAGGIGAAASWAKTHTGSYPNDEATLHSYVGRNREHLWRFFCTDIERNGGTTDTRAHMIFCQQESIGGGYRDENDWGNFQAISNYAVRTPVAASVVGKSFGAAFMDDGYGLLYTAADGVYWKFVGNPTPVSYDDVGSPGDRTPWPADKGVNSDLTGQVCGMARNNAGALVAILLDSRSLTAARSTDNTGAHWDSWSIGSVSLDVPPYIVAIEDIFYLVYQTTVSPGIYNPPAFLASKDAGQTWS